MALDNKDKGLFPFEVRDVDPDLNSEITKDYSGIHAGHVQVGPQKWFLTKEYAKETENLYNFKFRKDDVVVATFPRSEQCGPFWEHLKEGWSRRNEENVLFMFYEDIAKDLRSVIEKIAGFLGQSYTNEEFKTLENHLQIDNFRKNRAVNLTHRDDIVSGTEPGFIRKGKTGGWKDYFDEQLEKRADEWIEKNLKDTDLRFP